MNYQIETFSTFTSTYGQPGFTTGVKIDNVEWLLTQLDGETDWYLDLAMVNGLPSFNHGEGARAGLNKKVLKQDSPMYKDLEEMKQEWLKADQQEEAKAVQLRLF